MINNSTTNPAVWSGGALRGGSGSIFLNPAGARIDVQSATAAMNDYWTGGSTLRSLGALEVNSGTLTLSTTDIDLATGSLLDGSGTLSVIGAGSTTLNANVGSATTPEVLNLTGDWVPTVAPTVNITLHGTTPGTGAGSHGQFNVSGSATLTGSTLIVTAPGFTPQVGDTFTIVTCGGTCTGPFGTVNLPDFSGQGMVANINYTATAVIVEVTTP